MKVSIIPILLLATVSCSSQSKNDTGDGSSQPVVPDIKDSISYWVTAPSSNLLFVKKTTAQLPTDNTAGTITIDPSTTYQTMDGFGYALTGGSAQHITAMSTTARQAFLTEMFDSTNGIGVSYLRISIGASDLDATPFSYDDLPDNVSTDNSLQYFSIAKDKQTLIPVLKQILQINPHIKIMGSPWSPPVWMKDNKNTIGGKLKTDCYDVYARYFVKYIQAMKAEGINIDAITIQNEPLNPANNPSLDMQADEQLAFVKSALGPVFQTNNIATKIIVYDHNADRPDYPITILNDPDAAKYIDGSAFHLYNGNIDAVGTVHDKFPQKNLYFTEQWVGASSSNLNDNLSWHTENIIIGATRNWCKTALEWNISSNPTLTPHTPGGCTECLGAVTINGNNITRNAAYYIIAHASKLVRPGAVRIGTNTLTGLPNVAFKNPDGTIILIVLNKKTTSATFNISVNGKTFNTIMTPLSVETIIL
ncbi:MULTISPECIES: glycoside hydrolase family 30 protein [Chitinophagaceae]